MRERVALIAGPTASGKSDLAVQLALAAQDAGCPARIINADSAQVYRDLKVLSARPDAVEMRGVEHRLFGAWDGAEACSAAAWATAARREIADAHGAGMLPILVGGTGLYLRTLLDGIAPIPEIAAEVRMAVRALPVAEAHAALVREDPARAAMLHGNDSQRIARALEVVRSTGHPLGWWQQRREGGIGEEVALLPLVLLPDREWLYRRCDLRFARMMEDGAVEEVAALLARDLSPDLPVMHAIGVPEIAGWLQGQRDRAEAIVQGQQATRRYAKRQYTWFRNQPPADWQRVGQASDAQKQQITRILRTLRLT
ncbi:tRNA delta(2)-isopentenylpyrophosphate transferase [Croceibacterium mercuriale]|uniref:tRNA dimethylallyltransferase n=1 Tax=Croceibacterium mercuriale TaxID=1572751 RepID=A0A0B2C1R5_9SPHN|nr:tRNA (adenosine(37)-N6)-dimethylallyltransferase MiaA [Croceibacterium mercuriale]KHL25941.1 tRNA delta(2)-isopentenylpyrophosphate transferase [Croceibacterium mercuriale]